MIVPTRIHTARLLLRPWDAADARDVLGVLEANRDHLAPWIPARVAAPAPLEELAARLAGFADAFTADNEWRYAIVGLDDGMLLGEVSLFPRTADRRVPCADADRCEIGYWLRADRTGRGLATEAAQAMLDVAVTLPGMSLVEIRCDARNVASAAIPARLGFTLSSTVDAASSPERADGVPGQTQVWIRALSGAVSHPAPG